MAVFNVAGNKFRLITAMIDRLAGRREVSKAHIKRLSEHFRVEAGLFL